MCTKSESSGTQAGFRTMDLRAVGMRAQTVQDQRERKPFPSVSVNKWEGILKVFFNRLKLHLNKALGHYCYPLTFLFPKVLRALPRSSLVGDSWALILMHVSEPPRHLQIRSTPHLASGSWCGTYVHIHVPARHTHMHMVYLIDSIPSLRCYNLCGNSPSRCS